MGAHAPKTRASRPPPHPSPASGGGSSPSSGEASHVASGTATHHLTWLALEPLTGRTHQLRVHCAAMGWPIVGDTIYGNAPRAGGPVLHLHAREIVVPLYKNRDADQGVAPVPLHMQERLARVRLAGRGRLVEGSRADRPRSIQRRLQRSGAVRSCSGPPSLPPVRSARIVPALGRLLRSTWREASHSFERTIALAHW